MEHEMRIGQAEWLEITGRFANVADAETLYREQIALKERLGAVRTLYIHFPPYGTCPTRDPVTVSAVGFHNADTEAYIRHRLWSRSPTVRRAITTGMPFFLDGPMLGVFDPAGTMVCEEARETARRMDEAAAEHEVLVFAVFGPQGRIGYMAFWMPGGEPRIIPQEIVCIHHASTLAHIRYCALRTAEGLGETVELTRRETVALTLCAEGHGLKSAARQIGTRESTVRSVLRSAGAKLGFTSTENRAGAILKAVGLGLLNRKGEKSHPVAVRTPAGRRIDAAA